MKKLQAKASRVFRQFSRVLAREIITGDPILPPELERMIFEFVAVNDGLPDQQHVGETTLAVAQVCRRAQNWIEPFIYEQVLLLEFTNHAAFLATIAARPVSFFAAHVKHLYFDYASRCTPSGACSASAQAP
ncbi:hypothetical protein B0H19DRAFT_1250388 [Mycena capillaripes]|nr:hypothetical protein B0H19DRAFT_1250388 [Mycena capillaripes]